MRIHAIAKAIIHPIFNTNNLMYLCIFFVYVNKMRTITRTSKSSCLGIKISFLVYELLFIITFIFHKLDSFGFAGGNSLLWDVIRFTSRLGNDSGYNIAALRKRLPEYSSFFILHKKEI